MIMIIEARHLLRLIKLQSCIFIIPEGVKHVKLWKQLFLNVLIVA